MEMEDLGFPNSISRSSFFLVEEDVVTQHLSWRFECSPGVWRWKMSETRCGRLSEARLGEDKCMNVVLVVVRSDLAGVTQDIPRMMSSRQDCSSRL